MLSNHSEVTDDSLTAWGGTFPYLFLYCIPAERMWTSTSICYTLFCSYSILQNSRLDWICTVETLLDKLQLVEWNSLTKLHKRGQNPHGESHHWASSFNDTGLLSQSISCHCLNHSYNSAHSRQHHAPLMLLYFAVRCIYHSVSLFLFLPFIT